MYAHGPNRMLAQCSPVSEWAKLHLRSLWSSKRTLSFPVPDICSHIHWLLGTFIKSKAITAGRRLVMTLPLSYIMKHYDQHER